MCKLRADKYLQCGSDPFVNLVGGRHGPGRVAGHIVGCDSRLASRIVGCDFGLADRGTLGPPVGPRLGIVLGLRDDGVRHPRREQVVRGEFHDGARFVGTLGVLPEDACEAFG